MQTEINAAKRVVIKVGSSLLIRDNALDTQWLAGLAEDIKVASSRGQQIMVVTSGAVALGSTHSGLERQTLTLEQKQAAAHGRAWARAQRSGALAADTFCT